MHECMECGLAEPDHTRECPFVTGVWPIGPAEIAANLVCAECEVEFRPEDSYGLVESEPNIALIVCLGCAAHEGLYL